MSRPARALWIEIDTGTIGGPCGLWSRPARALWIEIDISSSIPLYVKSRPARALWIEIAKKISQGVTAEVEAREGLVD